MDDENWLARQIILVKLGERDTMHCQPKSAKETCNFYLPCEDGVPGILGSLARGGLGGTLRRLERVPKIGAFVKPIKTVLLGIANGTLGWNELETSIDTILPSSKMRDWVFNKYVFPIVRQHGFVIGGRRHVGFGPGLSPPACEKKMKEQAKRAAENRKPNGKGKEEELEEDREEL